MEILKQKPARPESRLDIRGITKQFGDITAVDSVDLTVSNGEFVSLLGQSGSGKTTLLMVIAGLIRTDAGEIWIDGKNATFDPPHLRDLGVVFQNYALFPHMTVAENIAFPLQMRGMSEKEIGDRVQMALNQVRLPNVGNRMPSQLSGGQQQRIAFARATVFNPSILLMDEPLGALDKKLRDELQMEIKLFQEELGITILYVTHDQDEALTMSDRICLLNEGTVAQLGTPAELYYQPASRFAASFVGNSNVLSGEFIVENDEAGVRLVDGPVIRGTVAGSSLLKNGDPCVATFRPELVQEVSGRPLPTNNVVTATIKNSIFVGDVTRLILQIASGQELMMNELSTPVRRLRNGDSVALCWPAAQTTIFPDDGPIT